MPIRSMRAAKSAGEGRGCRPGTVRCHEVAVRVHEDRAGQVRGVVVAPALAGIGQPPPDVADPERGVVESREQFAGGDEAHGRSLGCPADPGRTVGDRAARADPMRDGVLLFSAAAPRRRPETGPSGLFAPA